MGSSERGAPGDYAALYEAIPDAVFSIDQKGILFALNHIAETLSGYSREELIGQSIDVLLPETLRVEHAKYRESFMARPTTREMGVLAGAHLRRKDGKEVPVEIKLIPIGKAGAFGVNCILRDTSVNHLREVRLRQRAKNQAALARLGQGALSSGSLEALFDNAVSTLASALDVEFCEVLKLAPDRQTLLLASGVGWKKGLVGRATVGTDADSQAGYTLLSDGPVIVADLRTETRFSGPPLLTDHGVVSGVSVGIRCGTGPWGVLGIHTVRHREFSTEDVHFLQATANFLAMAIERDASDRARRESEDRMRASQKLEAIGRLAGGIAHDFNNLLVVIMSSAETLDADGGNEDAKAILSAAERAASLTHQLLTFSRRQILQPRILDLNAEISEMVDMLGRVLGEDIELAMSLASDVGCVLADQSQIQQVILNLAINARDALPHGGQLAIETTNMDIANDQSAEHPSLRPGPYVAIRVSDTGVGMDADVRSRAFDPFFTTKGDDGTGIGLATVYGIVTQSGGSIRIESEKGRGSMFEILLPRVVEPLDLPVQTDDVPLVPSGTETILVVEDEDAVRRMLCRGLERHGYHVLEANGSAAALEISGQHPGPIALVVTDMVMPGMRGDELLRHLREARPNLPALVVSGFASDVDTDSWLKEPNTSFLSKPFTSIQLVAVVHEMVDH